MSERDCASNIAAFTPPPCKQRIRGSELVSGLVEGSLGSGGDIVEGMIETAIVPQDVD
jgi:hypothetical protein